MRGRARPLPQKGFTLVELLAATSLLAIVLGSLYMSFQTGLAAYARSEKNLVEGREGDIFLIQLEEELKNVFPYFLVPFVGNQSSVAFPLRHTHYTSEGIEESVCRIEYRFEKGDLVRTEEVLKGGLKKKEEETETLFQKLEDGRFDFLYVDRSGKLLWLAEWNNEPYLGLPRGVRVTLAGDVFGRKGKTLEVLIPQGILVKRA